MRMNIPENGQKRIVIVGAGFAGLTLAQKLRNSAFQVVLIDKNNYHQFQPLFYQVAMSGLEPSSISFPLRKIFQGAKNMFIRVTSVDEIDDVNKEVKTPIGNLKYDYLVIGIGADTNFFNNEQYKQFAIPMKSVSEALFLRNAILSDYEVALTEEDPIIKQSLLDFVIVGGGPTGVELAGAIAEMKKYILPKDYPELNIRDMDIYLVQSGARLLDGMSDQAAQKAETYLTNLGVIIRKNAPVTGFDGEFVYIKDGSVIRAKKVIWAAGITGNRIPGIRDEAIVWGKRMKVDRFNQVDGYQNIFAVGDIAYMETEKYPKGHPQIAQVAIQQARLLYKNLMALENNKPKKEFEYKDLGSMATIGRHKAVVDLPFWKFQGAFAWFVWLFVHLMAIIGVKNKLFIFLNWLWNYMTYDQSLRLIIRPRFKP